MTYDDKLNSRVCGPDRRSQGDYRWCGYGEACAGQRPAQAGLRHADASVDPDWATEKTFPSAEVLAWYCRLFFGKGGEERDRDGAVTRRGYTETEIEAVQHNKGRLRVRYFTDGAILGAKTFVEDVFHHRRACAAWTKRIAYAPHGLWVCSQ